MDEIVHNGQTYRVGLMGVMTEFHVSRRMGAAMVETITNSLRHGDALTLLPEVLAWGGLSNEDTNYIVNACMGCLTRHDSAREAWAPVWINGTPMFQDIDHKAVRHLVTEVLRIRIGPFLPEDDRKGSGDGKGATGPLSQGGSTS